MPKLRFHSGEPFLFKALSPFKDEEFSHFDTKVYLCVLYLITIKVLCISLIKVLYASLVLPYQSRFPTGHLQLRSLKWLV